MKKSKTLILLIVICCFLLIGCKKKDEYVTIKLNPLNDEQVEELRVKKDEKIYILKSFTMVGFMFGGWYYDRGLTKKVTFPLVAKSDMELYASWVENLTYEFDSTDNTYIVTSVKPGVKIIEIPEMHDGFPVTKIGEKAFFSQENVEKIVLPETIKNIGESAFAYCTNLKEINLPDSIEEIGNKVFNKCNKLIYQDINGLKYINNWLVDATTAVMERTSFLEETVGIFPYAFYQNENINTIVLPNKVKKIYEGTFEESSLTKLVINQSLKEIDLYAFRDATKIEEIEVNPSNNYFSSVSGVLYNKDQTKLILYPANRQNTKYEVLATTKIIGFRSCMNNNYLKELVIPNSVEIIESKAFYNCKKIEKISFGENVKKIETEAFMFCNNLEEINLPLSLEIIENNSFAGCNNVKSLSLPYLVNNNQEISIIKIFGDELEPLTSITSLSILSGTSITKTSLKGLINLRNLELGNSIYQIEEGAFSECTKINKFVIDDSQYFKVINNVLYSADKKIIVWALPYDNSKKIELLDSTEIIYSSAFKDIDQLQEIVVNETLKEVHGNAFYNLPNITKLIFKGVVDLFEQDICINTPNITIYMTQNKIGDHWSEGWNTFNYPVIWNAVFPKIKVDEIERHIEVGEQTTFSYEVINIPDDFKYNIKITVVNDGICLIDGNNVTGLKDGIIYITIEIEGYPDSAITLYIYVGNI